MRFRGTSGCQFQIGFNVRNFTTRSSEMAGAMVNKDDIMKILVATDVHLGYGEKRPVIG